MATLGSKIVIAASDVARTFAKNLDKIGASMEVAQYTERLVPSTRFVAVDGVAPTVSSFASFVAPSANVIGDVTIGEKSSIWYGATVRGDVNKVSIGKNSSIGDRVVVHVAKIQGDRPTIIGDNVSVGPGAIIHAATLKDYTIVGACAQVLDGSEVGSNSIVAPGSILSPGTVIPSGEIWAGAPAKMVRRLTAEELENIVIRAKSTAELAVLHADECSKDFKKLAEDEEQYEDDLVRDPDYHQPGKNPNLENVLGQGPPGRIFNTTLSHPEEGLKIKSEVNKKI